MSELKRHGEIDLLVEISPIGTSRRCPQSKVVRPVRHVGSEPELLDRKDDDDLKMITESRDAPTE